MIPADIREAQGDACLEAAEKHHDLLLRVAQHLAGSAEGGMELFQQNLLNCHDAIRRMPNGFTGDRYEFYLLASLKNLHLHSVLVAALKTPFPAWRRGFHFWLKRNHRAYWSLKRLFSELMAPDCY